MCAFPMRFPDAPCRDGFASECTKTPHRDKASDFPFPQSLNRFIALDASVRTVQPFGEKGTW
jgi:hypothetical protein